MKPTIISLIQSSCLLFCSLIASMPAWAQVTTDGTTSTTVTSPDGNNFTINDGDRAAGNLFHSFQDFSVPTNGSAFFDNAVDIDNIISRVTGGNISSIDGLLRANGSANLFLINPAGIIFGQNARLDIGGSFLGSTADSLLFDDGTEFSATDTQTPILTINAPIGLNFRDNPGDITVRGDGQGTRKTNDLIDTENTLRVNSDRTLGLIGGNLIFEGATLKTAGGRIELGSVEAGEQVGLTQIENGWLVGYENVANFGDIQLNQISIVDASGLRGGEIGVSGQNITLNDGSQIEASTLGSQGEGSIEVFASESLTLNGNDAFFTAITSQVYPEVSGDAGNITITTGSLNVTNGAVITSSTFGQGDAGDLTINTGSLDVTNGAQIDANTFGQGDAGTVTMTATDTVSFDGEGQDGSASVASSTVGLGAEGNAGGVTITTGSLDVTNGAQIASSTLGQGDAGDVMINTGSLNITNEAFITSSTFLGQGDAGDVMINTGSLNITNGASINADTGFGQGNAGTVTITATDSVSFDGDNSGAFSRVGSRLTEGNAGGVTITTGSLDVTNGAFIDASTFGQGDAGAVTITATDSVSFDNSSIVGSQVGSEAVGNAGGVTITTDSLDVTNGAQISASTLGQGDAGTVTITATDSISFDGESQDGNPSGVASTVESGAEGDAGGVAITTGSLDVTNGAVISANTFGQGDAGMVTITATDSVSFDGESQDGNPSGVGSEVGEEALGNAGGVTITTDSLDVTNGAGVSASTFGQGNAGAVTITATDSVSFDGERQDGFSSGAYSTVELGAEGNAGGVTITTDSLDVTNGAIIDASTFGQGNGGSVFVEADTLNLDNGSIVATNEPSQPIAANENDLESGNITLEIADNLILRNNSSISARAGSNATGGNLNIDAQLIIAFPSQFNGNDILASAEEGRGGNIDITAESLLGIKERPQSPFTNDIDASSELGLDGTVSINSPDISVLQENIEAPEVVEPQTLGANACSGGEARGASSFTITGKGGVPPEPTEPFTADPIAIEGKSVPIGSEPAEKVGHKEIKPIITAQGEIYPARGMILKENGDLILTAYPTSNVQRTPHNSRNCRKS